MAWQALSTGLLDASQAILGNLVRRHQDWFHDNATDIRSLVNDKNVAHNALLRNPTSHTFYVQRKLRWIEKNWWVEMAAH